MRKFATSYRGAKRALSLLIVLLMWIATGCTAIPENVTLVVESTPTGANVTSSEGWQCRTPCTLDVPRDSKFELTFVQPDYQSIKQTVEIPELKPSRTGTYIGVGVGAVAGIVAIDFTELFGSLIFDAFFFGALGPFELSTSEKLELVAIQVLAYGGIGYAVDRILDRRRGERPHRVDVSMVKPSEADANPHAEVHESNNASSE